MESVNALEVDGVCMPHTLAALCELFDTTQEGEYEVTVVVPGPGSGTLNCAGAFTPFHSFTHFNSAFAVVLRVTGFTR